MLRILGAVYKCISNLCHYLPMCILHAHEIIIIIIIIIINLFNCISVMDDTEINEQNKSIATVLIYIQPKFDAFSTLVQGEMLNSNPLG